MAFSHANPDFASYPGAGNWADPRIVQGAHPPAMRPPAPSAPAASPSPAVAQSPLTSVTGGLTGGSTGGSPLGGESLFGQSIQQGPQKPMESPLGRLGESSQIQAEEMRRLYELIVAANRQSRAHMDTERPYVGSPAPQGSMEDSSGLYGARNIRGIG